VAGPGTGKTRVVTRRVGYLVEDQGIDARRILALTFSRAAAGELRQRLESMLGQQVGHRPSVYTLHAFALRQLLLNKGAPNLPHPIRIADDYDERWVVHEEIAQLTGLRVKHVQREFQNLASDWETLEAEEDNWEHQHPNPAFLGAWRRHREVYGYTLRAELVYALKKALDHAPDLEMEPEFEHVLADEYQDLNRCELAVLERLVGDSRTLFVAGDDDQSIYGFRNAFPAGLREFRDTYPESEDGELAECHRCDKDILAMSLNVAEQDVDRLNKQLHARDDAGDGQVEAFSFKSATAEAAGIAAICRQLVDQAGVSPGDILILLRNNPRGIYSEPIIHALGEQGLGAELPADPFAVLGEEYPRMVVCLMRLLRDRDDGLAWREILKLRDNKIGDGSLMAVYRLADERGERYQETLALIADNPEILEHARRKTIAAEVEAVEEILDGLRDALELDAAEGLEALLDAIAFPEGDERELVTELLLNVTAEDDGEEEPKLKDVETALHSSRGSLDEAERDADPDSVQIMSMHAAKGLTAEAVIVAACDDELMPGETESKRQLDDERRLLYVSLTRAKHFLFVTFARRRLGRQSHMMGVPEDRTYTRFLQDYLPPTAN